MKNAQSSSRNIPEGKAGKPILRGPRWPTRWRPPGGAATGPRCGTLRQQRRGLPARDPGDPGYRRLRYLRYADDHLFGFTGPKAEAEQIKQRLAGFLHDDLKLELSEGKTLITHGRTQAARFLGYDITVQHSPCRPSVNGVIGLRVPRAVITAKTAPYLTHGKPGHRPELMNLDDPEIISAYGAEYRGLVQYYLLAGNVSRLHRLRWAAETSMLKTLAAKHRSTVTKMARKYKATVITPHGPRTCFEARTERPGRKPLVARFGGIPLKRQKRAVLDDRLPAPAPARRKELVTRLLRGRCEWCQQHGPVQAHQVRKLADLGTPGPAQPRMGQPDGADAAQDAHRLRRLPSADPRREASRDLHVIVTGEPDAPKGARPVRTGGRRKRTRTTGTSPAAYRCGSGASWPNWRPSAWSPWLIRAIRVPRTRRSRTGAGTSRNRRNRPTRPTRSSAHPESARTPSSRPAQDLENPPEAPLLPLARRAARQGHPRIANPRGITRMERVHCRTPVPRSSPCIAT